MFFFGMMNLVLYKVGPGSSYNWGEITPTYRGYFTPFITIVGARPTL